MVVYYVVCFFLVVRLLDSSRFVAIMRLRSSMLGSASSSSWTRSSSVRDLRQDDHTLGITSSFAS